MTLQVFLEIDGQKRHVGNIRYSSVADAIFSYEPDYLRLPSATAISLSLPLSETSFSPEATRTFFDGLLPEGFTRHSVAQSIHANEADYLTILSYLGSECLGAIQIVSDEIHDTDVPHYEELTLNQVEALAKEGATKSTELVTKAHLSLTGASGKVGLYWDASQGRWYLPKGSAPSTHIVKQSHVRLHGVVPNEQLCLLTASKLGIVTPESFIINTGDAGDDEILLAEKRYDRSFADSPTRLDTLPVPLRLHQEDMAQALGIAAADKYEKAPDGMYLRRVFEVLQSFSVNPIPDMLQLWDRMIFNYLIGNTDNHIKNISLLYLPNLQGVHLAPAYDMISTTVYESGTRDMSIFIDGKVSLDEVSRESFKNAARETGLGQALAMDRFDRMVELFEKALMESALALADSGMHDTEELAKRILKHGGFALL